MEDFKLSKRALLVFISLSVVTLMSALDGTSISVALPVRNSDLTQAERMDILTLQYR